MRDKNEKIDPHLSALSGCTDLIIPMNSANLHLINVSSGGCILKAINSNIKVKHFKNYFEIDFWKGQMH